MLPTEFIVSWPFDSEQAKKKKKIDFQDGCHGGHLRFPIKTILAIFDLQVTPMLPKSFKSVSFLVQEKKLKMDIQDGGHGGHLEI